MGVVVENLNENTLRSVAYMLATRLAEQPYCPGEPSRADPTGDTELA
jgi:hypothetical protein